MKKQIVYAVVDTETTGLRAGRDRITEAGIVFIKNGEIAGTWSRMVNPGVKIPEKISLLTGIHDKDVASAEEFFTLAEELDELTCDTVLVGHHVAFDYSFLKFEMGLAGMPFIRKTICTSELARFLFPDLRSYSLRYLCRYFGIINEQPHRAMADAKATAQLFLKLMQSEKVPDLEKIISGKRTMQFLPAHIRETILHRIPATPGIYYFFDRRGKPLYIGKASNLRSRVLSHFRGRRR